MKKSRLISLLTLAFSLILYFGCQRTLTDPGPGVDPDPENPPVTVKVSAAVSGRVVDDQQIPVQGAIVKAGNSLTSTDINGNFSFTKVSLAEDAGLVKVDKEGFFTGSRTFVVNKGTTNFVDIQLIKKESAGNFQAAGGGSITVPNGGSIRFDADAVINEGTGAAYTGTVTVSAFHINPEAANFKEIMPGALRGVDNSGTEVGLQSFGMMAVELTGAGGEKLQLAQGKPATITFPIPAALQAQAPATIPLWFFNDTTGLWKEAGVATRSGNNYVGKTDHFSFWNCDAPFPVVDFSAVIKDGNGNPYANTMVVIKAQNDAVSILGSGLTDQTGLVKGKVPANKALEIFLSNKCGTVLNSEQIGPFSTDTDLGTITISNSSQPFTVNFSGTAENCNNEPLSRGYVTIEVDGTYQRANVVNGNFSIDVLRCTDAPATATFVVFDQEENQAGQPLQLPVNGNNVTTGLLSACGISIEEYIRFTVDGTEYSLASPADTMSASIRDTTTSIICSSAEKSFTLQFSGSQTGPKGWSWLQIFVGNDDYTRESLTLNITEYGEPVLGYIAGTFSGTLYKGNTTGIPVSGEFRVRRQQ